MTTAPDAEYIALLQSLRRGSFGVVANYFLRRENTVSSCQGRNKMQLIDIKRCRRTLFGAKWYRRASVIVPLTSPKLTWVILALPSLG
jgi:hypothetical protein